MGYLAMLGFTVLGSFWLEVVLKVGCSVESSELCLLSAP